MRLRPIQGVGVTLAVAMVVGSCGVTPPSTVAAPIPGSHQGTPIQGCFNGAAGSYADVQTSNRTQLPAPGNYTLRCGDHTKGITQINDNHPLRTHPDDFLRCVTATILGGYPTAGNTGGTTLFEDFYAGPNAISYVVADDSSHDILTAYTNTGAQGNDWPGCIGT